MVFVGIESPDKHIRRVNKSSLKSCCKKFLVCLLKVISFIIFYLSELIILLVRQAQSGGRCGSKCGGKVLCFMFPRVFPLQI